MLSITIPETEYYDYEKEMFFTVKSKTLRLEHSLASLSKWESKWCKPFLSGKASDKSNAEIIDYIRCMCLDEVDTAVFVGLTAPIFEAVNNYIDAPMTATTFSKNIEEVAGKKVNRETVTAEIIYYWMISLNIPFECQYWHLNKLMTLIRVCSIKNAPPKKMGKSETRRRNKALNAARRNKLKSKG